jgi:hypothetical protein
VLVSNPEAIWTELVSNPEIKINSSNFDDEEDDDDDE